MTNYLCLKSEEKRVFAKKKKKIHIEEHKSQERNNKTCLLRSEPLKNTWITNDWFLERMPHVQIAV